jgi:hypothetical protein
MQTFYTNVKVTLISTFEKCRFLDGNTQEIFTPEEYTEMMIIYGESGRNSKAAPRLYRERFPHRRHPSSDVFLGLVNRTRTIGFLVPDRKRVGGVDRTVRSPDTYFNHLRKMEREVLEMWPTS